MFLTYCNQFILVNLSVKTSVNNDHVIIDNCILVHHCFDDDDDDVVKCKEMENYFHFDVNENYQLHNKMNKASSPKLLLS